MMKHNCCECHWCMSIIDSSNELIEICVFDQSANYLQQVGLCCEDCELDDFAEELWEREHDE